LEKKMSSKEPAAATAVTTATVVPGLGYPANRLEVSAEPTGWQHSIETFDVTNVSRETSR
jgi:hypothetical protein